MTSSPLGWYMLQRRGEQEVLSALQEEIANLILIERGYESEIVSKIRALANEQNLVIEEGSERDIWRMSRPAKGDEPEHARVLALTGRIPNRDNLDDLFANSELLWLLDGVSYATNLGFGIRTAEVSGADGVVLAPPEPMNHVEKRTMRKASMKAIRFLPVIESTASEIIECAKKHEFRIISAEDVGTALPWESDMTGKILLVVGAERHGICKEILDASDQIIRLPMAGFVPSYNLQVALSALAMEAMKQRGLGE